MGELRNSITKGDGNVIGFLGEIVVCDWLGLKQGNTYDYDFTLPNGKTVDVKTKRCRSIPKPDYDCSVSAFNTRQKCDYYLFNRIHTDLSKLWVLGYVEKQTYFNNAIKHWAGQTDLNGFTYKSDCYNMPIKKLKNPIDLEVLCDSKQMDMSF